MGWLGGSVELVEVQDHTDRCPTGVIGGECLRLHQRKGGQSGCPATPFLFTRWLVGMETKVAPPVPGAAAPPCPAASLGRASTPGPGRALDLTVEPHLASAPALASCRDSSRSVLGARHAWSVAQRPCNYSQSRREAHPTSANRNREMWVKPGFNSEDGQGKRSP